MPQGLAVKVFDNSWRTFAVRAAVLGAIVFGAVRFAVARPGVAGGPAGSFVTVAGTLTGVSGATMATFEFRRTGSTVVLCAPQVTITPGAGGAFSVPVPLDQPELSATARCPDDLFDGRDVQVRVVIGGNEVATWAPINPVPYAHYASVAGQVGVNNDCPAGYAVANDPVLPSSVTLCRRGLDEVVKVGRGATAFWIDRYEASVWSNVTGTDVQFGAGTIDDYPSSFPDNGQWTTPLYAVSRAGTTPEITPSRNMTWFQAAAACAASGKRLPTGQEWLQAARGTFDPPVGINSAAGQCNTLGSGVRANGRAARPDLVGPLPPSMFCVSAAGAENMIGNLWEWTAEWDAGLGNAMPRSTWPASYNDDITANISSSANTGPSVILGLPSAVLRGGHYGDGPGAGIFATNLNDSPAYSGVDKGFRCVIPR
jgi:formylglycine-generating enzyme required for sulfatase activity